MTTSTKISTRFSIFKRDKQSKTLLSYCNVIEKTIVMDELRWVAPINKNVGKKFNFFCGKRDTCTWVGGLLAREMNRSESGTHRRIFPLLFYPFL
jgi:hypothetical protein